jgi:hypothetical protein
MTSSGGCARCMLDRLLARRLPGKQSCRRKFVRCYGTRSRPRASSWMFICRAELNAQNYGAPIFIMSDQGDVPMAVDAIKNGAFDFIEKPFDADAPGRELLPMTL